MPADAVTSTPVWAPYMRWAKERRAARYDLAGSTLVGCSLADLPGAHDALELDGPNLYGYEPLVDAIGRRYGTSSDRVATGGGASGANFLALAALIRPGDDVLVERPVYDPLLGAIRLLGARAIHFDRTFEDGWGIDPDRVRAAVTPSTRLIVITSPHNPTGVLTREDTLRQLAVVARSAGAHILVDEVYLDAIYTDRPAPAATLDDVFVSTNSLTKSFGLMGLRCGWILASRAIAESVRLVRDVVDGNAAFPADKLALVAFQHIDRLEARARSILEPNLARLTSFIEQHDELEWIRPDGGTVAFPRIRALSDTFSFTDRLLQDHDTAVVPGAFFQDPAHFRIAFGCAPNVFERGLETIAATLANSVRSA